MFLFFVLFLQAQDEKIQIYIQKDRYFEKMIQELKFEQYHFLSKYYIDRYDQDTIDYQQLQEGLNVIVPDTLSADLLCLDLENQIYQNIKSPKKRIRKRAVDRFVEMIRFVKRNRPNIKVGIYGVPFRFNYQYQKEYNHYRQLKSLLKEVDYISPSLYFSYSEKEQNDEKLKDYIESNLDLFLKYAKKVDKPLYLYVWYLIHPHNKIYGKQIVSKERMNFFLKNIKNYEYKKKKVQGVIWWESSNSEYRLGKEPRRLSITEILKEYTQTLF